MGSTLNIIIFTIAIGFFLSISYFAPSQSSPIGDVLSGQQGLITELQTFFNPANSTNLIALAGAVAIGVTFFPNPWAIFLGPTLALFSWFVFPSKLLTAFLTGVSSPYLDSTNPLSIISMIQILFTLVFAFSLLSWYKGGGDL